ncbi:MAG: DUF3888 domain-containing protein [Candidatus Pristimantibacillus sp.]
MRKMLILFALTIVMTMMLSIHSNAEAMYSSPHEDSRELQFQDMMMLFLLPYIDKAVSDYYSKLLTGSPNVYPYQVSVIKVARMNRFRGFNFLITLEVSPVVGPPIRVGRDNLTFQVAPTVPNTVKLVKYEHLKTYELPPNWQHIIRRP